MERRVGKNHLKDLGVDGRMMLNVDLKDFGLEGME
jgi:hypothetical protein